MPNFDVIIVGGGIVGATAALALAQNSSLKIALFDSKWFPVSWDSAQYDHRVSAISLASQRIFKKLNVWKKITDKRMSPYTQMHVWEESGRSKIDFSCKDVQEKMLGYIIEDSVMRISLYEAMLEKKNIDLFPNAKLNSLIEKEDGIELVANDSQVFLTQLLIGADGANSWVREQAGIVLQAWDYGQTAIVATIKTENEHAATARQCFLKTGPLAFLPLQDPNLSSIVWSTNPGHAAELMSFDNQAFCEALNNAFANKLGDMKETSSRHYFPLHRRHAKNYVKDRIALIGDAAHTIHPLAGQGVNLGILDAVCLAEVVEDAFQKQRDFFAAHILKRYERWRKGDNLAMLAMIDALKSLFIQDKGLVSSVRNMGLNGVDRFSLLKTFLTNYAVGNRSDLPQLAI